MSGARGYRVARPPTNPGTSGWVAMLPPRAGHPELAAAITADVAIVGAGFAGLSAAWRLSEIDPSLRVVVFEAGLVGEGPAGRNSGFIIDLPHEVSSEDYGGDSLQKSRDHILVQRRAVGFAREAAATLGWGPEVLDTTGRFSFATTPEGDRHVADYARQLIRLEEPHSVLGPGELAGITGSAAFTSGLFMPGTVMVQPAAYIRGLADGLGPSVRLFERSPAMSLERTGTAWLARTPRGAVTAGRILLANNGHAERFGFFRGRFLHVFTYASMTEPFEPSRLGGHRRWAATPATAMGTTLRRIDGPDGDRLLVRSRYTYNPGLEVGEATLRRAGRQHDGKFARRFPSLTGVRMEHRWGGAMAVTWNGVPAFGEVDANLFAACGCNGLGASNATATGLAVAEMMQGVETDLTRVYRGFEAPKRLPPRPLTFVGAKATLALREWRAGAE